MLLQPPGIKLQIIFVTLSDAFVIDSVYWLDFLCWLGIMFLNPGSLRIAHLYLILFSFM